MYMQMELEADNLWLKSIGYDFDGKRKFIKKYYFFLVENIVAEKNPFFVGKFSRFPIVNNRRTRTRNLRNFTKVH